MLRNASAFLIAIAVVGSADAQVFRSYGFRAGASASNIAAEHVDLSYRLGFQLAAFAELSLRDRFAFQPELEFTRRGYASDIEGRSAQNEPLGTVRASTTLDYVALPVLLRFHLPEARHIRPYLAAGPRFDYLVRRDPGKWEFPQATLTDTMSNEFRSVSFGGTVGLGADFTGFAGREVRFGARYVFGFTDLLAEKGTAAARLRGIDVSLGIAW